MTANQTKSYTTALHRCVRSLLIPVLMIIVPTALVILQPNLGTSVMLVVALPVPVRLVCNNAFFYAVGVWLASGGIEQLLARWPTEG